MTNETSTFTPTDTQGLSQTFHVSAEVEEDLLMVTVTDADGRQGEVSYGLLKRRAGQYDFNGGEVGKPEIPLDEFLETRLGDEGAAREAEKRICHIAAELVDLNNQFDSEDEEQLVRRVRSDQAELLDFPMIHLSDHALHVYKDGQGYILEVEPFGLTAKQNPEQGSPGIFKLPEESLDRARAVATDPTDARGAFQLLEEVGHEL